MRALVRRVHEAEVIVNDHSVGAIKQGLLVYLGICRDDEENDIEWIAKKILGMRIFDDSTGLMNLPISESKGILVVSQFTLFGNLRQGTRPSFNCAARGDFALQMYLSLYDKLRSSFAGTLAKGEFGEEMKITASDDGPVSIWLDSKNKAY